MATYRQQQSEILRWACKVPRIFFLFSRQIFIQVLITKFHGNKSNANRPDAYRQRDERKWRG